MAKQAKMQNLTGGRGVNIFTNGLPTENLQQTQAEENQQPAREQPAQEQPVKEQSTAVPLAPPAPVAPEPIAPQPAVQELKPSSKKEKSTVLRSYHLPKDLIARLDDAHMVYQLRKEEKDKQDIVTEALRKHLENLEQEGFFEVLTLLRK